MVRFYDTCSLLNLQEELFNTNQSFLISSISLTELENIKTSGTKDEEIKWKARQLLHLLKENAEKFQVLCCTSDIDKIIEEYHLLLNNDSRIIAQAIQYNSNVDNVIFCTNDLACYEIAKNNGLTSIYTSDIPEDDYTGYKIIEVDDTGLADLYSITIPYKKNNFDLLPNQYLLIKYNNEITDKYKWNGEEYLQIPFQKLQSKMFGKITPKNNDPFQQIAIDSLISNKITMLRGPAGTGKSYLAFGYMFNLLEEGKIDKIIIFCNTVATKGSAKLGFYPGSRTEKLMDSQIGNLLASKLGDRVEVERLVDNGQLVLLPMSDIRGYDTTGMNAAVYITEAQNLDVELMRLALQRIGDDSICILDGDSQTQVDMSMYAGTRNGMRRVSEVFRGQSFYGEVTLKNIHRSPIARLAQKL
jgi:predicted ribonuclease YlaK